MMNSLPGMALILVSCGGLLAGLARWQRSRQPDPELVRKLFHLGMGCLTLGIPWLLSDVRAALGLAVITLVLLLTMRRHPALRNRMGGVLGGVGRRSYGEMFFVGSITALFCWARNSPLLYLIPILILTFADALAALAGARYGRHRYRTIGGEKSMEGSLVFLLTAAMVTALPLLLLTKLPLAQAACLALAVSLPLTVVEALSWRGLDNLLVPLTGFRLLKELLMCSAEEIRTIVMLMGGVFLIVLAGWQERKLHVALHQNLSWPAAKR